MIFCTSCGKQKDDAATFCPHCGTAPSAEVSSAEAPSTEALITETPPATTPSIDTPLAPITNDGGEDSYGPSKKLIAIIAGVAALLIIGVVTVVANPGGIFRGDRDRTEAVDITVTDNVTDPTQDNIVDDIIEDIVEVVIPRPEPPLSQAFETLARETAQRIDGTPLSVLGLMLQSLESGTTNIDVRQGGTFGLGVELALLSNLHEDEFLLQAAVNAMGVMRVETDIHLTYDSLAIRVPLFDNNFYGIRLSTLDSDLQAFGSVFGFPEEITEMFASFSEVMEAAADLELAIDEDFYVPYAEALSRFFDSLALTASDDTFEGVAVTRYEYIVTLEDMVALLRDLYATLADDENMRALFEFYDHPLFYEEFGIDYSEMFEDMLDELEWAIEELEFEMENMSLDIAVALYISNANRLMRMTIGGDMTFDGEAEVFPVGIVANFGTSVYDTWSIYVTDAFPEDSVRVYWYFLDDSTGYENSIFVHTTDFWGGEEIFHFYTVWTPSTGRFIMRFTDGIWIDESFTGNFIRDDRGNYTLGFTVADFEVTISGEPGVPNIPFINFINIDEWDEDLIDRVEVFVEELMIMLEGF